MSTDNTQLTGTISLKRSNCSGSKFQVHRFPMDNGQRTTTT